MLLLVCTLLVAWLLVALTAVSLCVYAKRSDEEIERTTPAA